MKKAAKILLVIIYLFLLAFLGFGCYLIFSGVVGAGLLSIAIFLFAGGATGLLRVGLFDEPRMKLPKSGKELNAKYEVPCDFKVWKGAPASCNEATLYVTDDMLYVEGPGLRLFATDIMDIRQLHKEPQGFTIDGYEIFNQTENQFSYQFTPVSALKGKAAYQVIADRMEVAKARRRGGLGS